MEASREKGVAAGVVEEGRRRASLPKRTKYTKLSWLPFL
jgi:hypothetical protein